MKSIIQILMDRDGLSRSEAVSLVEDCRSEMNELIALGMYEDAEYVMEHELGLELDYVFDLF